MGIGWKLAAIMALILVTVCGLGYWYYEDQQARMAILQENNAKLTVAVQVNEETIKVMKEHDTQQAAQINELQEGLNRATQDRKDLEAKFRNKDISAMGRKDAKLLEDKINRATQRAFDDLEKTTGLTDVPMPSANTGAKNAQ